MAIVKTYLCGECGTKFDKLHFDRSEPPPECPGCQAIEAKQVPAGFAIGGNTHSKALDLTQDIVEKDFGMTDLRDNVKEGEIAAVLPKQLTPAVNNFWKPNNQAFAMAKAATATMNAEGRNPMTMVQRGIKRAGRTSGQVICRPVNSVR